MVNHTGLVAALLLLYASGLTLSGLLASREPSYGSANRRILGELGVASSEASEFAPSARGAPQRPRPSLSALVKSVQRQLVPEWQASSAKAADNTAFLVRRRLQSAQAQQLPAAVQYQLAMGSQTGSQANFEEPDAQFIQIHALSTATDTVTVRAASTDTAADKLPWWAVLILIVAAIVIMIVIALLYVFCCCLPYLKPRNRPPAAPKTHGHAKHVAREPRTISLQATAHRPHRHDSGLPEQSMDDSYAVVNPEYSEGHLAVDGAVMRGEQMHHTHAAAYSHHGSTDNEYDQYHQTNGVT